MASELERSYQPPSCHTLKYTIASASEHSGTYVADNILRNEPTDTTSRWSGAYQAPAVKQWITLKLDRLSIVSSVDSVKLGSCAQLIPILESITFGKFHRSHPCNMKEFKLLLGTSEDNMTQVLRSGLKNDSVSETFSIRHINHAGVGFPTRYVQIVPLSAHGQSFHTSIWFVSLSGIDEPSYVERIRANHEIHRERVALKHVMKHLRQRRLLTPIEFIQFKCNVQLEHPLIASLHKSLVLKGDFSSAEETLHPCLEQGLFDSYIKSSQPQAMWTRLHVSDADGDAPTKRGGHAMCIDGDSGLIYLHGGWDGKNSLDDFWVYDIAKEKWRILSPHTGHDKNGPGPRACHKMTFDRKMGSIYILGKLADEEGHRIAPEGSSTDLNPPTSVDSQFCSEFYRYRTRGLDAGNWELLTFDTAAAGGPPLIFDHQLAIDSDAQTIYVFGGRIVDSEKSPAKYSGLYSYDIRTSKWKNLQLENPSQAIPCRFGHSMVLDPDTRTLYVFAGQREDRYLSDMWTYDITTNIISELWPNYTVSGGPDPCFTQRAVINTKSKEIYMMCGLTRVRTGSGSKTELEPNIPKWVFRYDKPPGKWTRILPDDFEDRPDARPQPRYAHQMVYDPKTDAIFIHGGNGGIIMEGGGVDDRGEDVRGEKENRLDDFWTMKLKRIAPEEVIRRAKFKLRTQQFREMCEEKPAVKALDFLQTEVASVVDHTSTEEAIHFRSLLTHLLHPGAKLVPQIPSSGSRRAGHNHQEGPRKRSRSEDTWTSKLDEDEDVTTNEHTFHARPLEESWVSDLISNIEEDPVEEGLRRGSESLSPSAERFKQRTEVFEALLEFVDEHAKEPEGNLIDYVNKDDDEL